MSDGYIGTIHEDGDQEVKVYIEDNEICLSSLDRTSGEGVSNEGTVFTLSEAKALRGLLLLAIAEMEDSEP